MDGLIYGRWISIDESKRIFECARFGGQSGRCALIRRGQLSSSVGLIVNALIACLVTNGGGT